MWQGSFNKERDGKESEGWYSSGDALTPLSENARHYLRTACVRTQHMCAARVEHVQQTHILVDPSTFRHIGLPRMTQACTDMHTPQVAGHSKVLVCMSLRTACT